MIDKDRNVKVAFLELVWSSEGIKGFLEILQFINNDKNQTK